MKARDSIITGPQGFVNLAGLAVTAFPGRRGNSSGCS